MFRRALRSLSPFLVATLVACGGSSSSGLKVVPGEKTLAPNDTFQFTAELNGVAQRNVTWSVPPGSGTIAADGTYTAPPTEGTYRITATLEGGAGGAIVHVATVSVHIVPNAVTVPPNGQQQFGAGVTAVAGGLPLTGVNTSVTYTIQEGAAGGTITPAGLYTAPATAGTYHVVATSVADPTKSDVATVTVGHATVAITATGPTSVGSGGMVSFTATVTGAPAGQTGVTWSVPAGAGTITAGGVYTAPAVAGTYTVTATSTWDPSAFATVTITVYTITVAITPKTVTMQVGGTQAFSATATAQ